MVRAYQLELCGCSDASTCRCKPIEDQPYIEATLLPVASPTPSQIRWVRDTMRSADNFVSLRRLLQRGGFGPWGQMFKDSDRSRIDAELARLGLEASWQRSLIWRKVTPKNQID